MPHLINRRAFFKQMATWSVVLSAPPLLSGCGAAPAVAPIVARPVVQKLGQLAVGFLFDVGAQVVANEIGAWRDSQRAADQADIDMANKMLIAEQFDQFKGVPVYQTGPYSFYYVYSSRPGEEYNACMPCLPLGLQGHAINMFEGPTFVILRFMAQEYKGLNRLSPGEALLPFTNEVTTPGARTQHFKGNFDFQYNTLKGHVEISHRYLGDVPGGFEGSYSCFVNDGDANFTLGGEYSFLI